MTTIQNVGSDIIYGQGMLNGTAGPHAIKRIMAPAADYLNMARSVQNITYTGFNKTGYISVMNNNNGENQKWELNIEYGPDNFRRTTRLTMNNELVKSKVFAGGNYEIETDARQQQRRLHYISGGSGLCAIFVTDDASEDGNMYYILKDHLGSIYAVTNEEGEIATYNGRQQIYSFDPWGRRRNPGTWTFEGVADEYLFDRGFTGHEHLDELGLINMNGRMYEPWLGRFLSPDNYVQMPGYSQNLNRYSYALNNPLKYTDPSGNMVNSIFGNMSSVNTHNLIIGQPTKLQQAASFLIIAVMTAGVGPAYMAAAIPQAMAAFAGGFLISSISAWISGGSFGSGINAGFMGGMNGAMAILTTAAISASFTEMEDYYRQNVRAIRRMKRMNKVNLRMLQKNKGSLVTTTSSDGIDIYGFQKKYFNNVKGLNEIHTDKIPDGYTLDESSKYFIDNEDNEIGGVTDYLGDGESDVYLSPYAMQDKLTLYEVLGHELIHVAHYNKFGNKFNTSASEYAAYNWSYNVVLNMYQEEETEWSSHLLNMRRLFRPREAYKYDKFGFTTYPIPRSLWE